MSIAIDDSKLKQPSPTEGYIVQNRLAHRRLLPKESAHTFAYSAPYLLVSLTALEQHRLDKLRGWLFGYGGVSLRVTGIRPSGYFQLSTEAKTIKAKLLQLLTDRGIPAGLQDIWMLTMPSYFGYKGINPLTVYFCYNLAGEPWLVVLEIHNTFGERHIHVLLVDEAYTSKKALHRGYRYQWTFPREFHVSPFNDRTGFYHVSADFPFPSIRQSDTVKSPRARIRVDLHTSSTEDASGDSLGPLKLVATMEPLTSAPLTSWNLLKALLVQPFVLFMSWPRICYQAWILHYKKRLDVFARPDPYPPTVGWPNEDHGKTGGVLWQDETWVERFARRRVEGFLRRRVDETGISVTLKPANLSVAKTHFVPNFRDRKEGEEKSVLVIAYLTPAAFTTLFVIPSAAHALAIAEREKQLFVSSRDLFLKVFTEGGPRTTDTSGPRRCSIAQRLRLRQLPVTDTSQHGTNLDTPQHHNLDQTGLAYTHTLFVLFYVFVTDNCARLLYDATHARFVRGQEPWRVWERGSGAGLGMTAYASNVQTNGNRYHLGSIRREE